MKRYCLSWLIFFTFSSLWSVTYIDNVSITVGPVDVINIDESGTTIQISSADAIPGITPMTSKVLTTNTYSFTSISTKKRKITGILDTELPDGVTLEASLSPPTGAISRGFIPLNTSANQTLVSNIAGNSKESNLQISFVLKSTTDAGPIPPSAVQVTLLIEDDL